MYCSDCGKQNPAGAKFCAFCGKALSVEGKPTDSDVKHTETPQDPHQAYKRPDGDDVRPISSNPAQPVRSSEQRPALPRQQTPKPQQPAAQPATRRPQGAVTSSGGEVMPPSRAPNVKKAGGYGQVTHRQPVVSPYAQAQKGSDADEGEDDLFFEDVDEPYDDAGEEDNLVRHLKSAIAVLFLLLVVGTLGWLFLTHSGQMFRAEMGLAAPAEIYHELGDEKTARNDLRGAAEAYYKALSEEPGNYYFAMSVGQAYEALGDYETAFKAYQKCRELRDNLPDPYLRLAEVLEKNGDHEKAMLWRQEGYSKTGDASLLRSDPRTGSEDIQDPVPAMPAG